jgi:hypothetical protein
MAHSVVLKGRELPKDTRELLGKLSKICWSHDHQSEQRWGRGGLGFI